MAIEEVIPFWEFIDIEYDNVEPALHFTCHYRHIPDFEYLYKKIADSTILERIQLELQGKATRIIGSGWKTKAELEEIPDAKNVIYYLLDELNRQIYVGKANSLKARLSANRREIPGWTHFRYDQLPDVFSPYLEEVELMIINSFMHLCACDAFAGTPKLISDYTLRNKKHIKKK